MFDEIILGSGVSVHVTKLFFDLYVAANHLDCFGIFYSSKLIVSLHVCWDKKFIVNENNVFLVQELSCNSKS